MRISTKGLNYQEDCLRALHLRGMVVMPFRKDGGIYEDESCGNGGFGVGPSQHRRPDFVQQI